MSKQMTGFRADADTRALIKETATQCSTTQSQIMRNAIFAYRETRHHVSTLEALATLTGKTVMFILGEMIEKYKAEIISQSLDGEGG